MDSLEPNIAECAFKAIYEKGSAKRKLLHRVLNHDPLSKPIDESLKFCNPLVLSVSRYVLRAHDQMKSNSPGPFPPKVGHRAIRHLPANDIFTISSRLNLGGHFIHTENANSFKLGQHAAYYQVSASNSSSNGCGVHYRRGEKVFRRLRFECAEGWRLCVVL